jgi:hypothetical protein
MPKLTLGNDVFNYPDPGEEPGYGKDASDWAEAATEILNSLAGTGSINETEITLQAAGINEEIPGLLFSSALVESANVFYTIYRRTDSEELSEQGTLFLVYVPSDAAKWKLTRVISASGGTVQPGSPDPSDAKVRFDILATGQLIYNSLPLQGTNYSGYIKFKTSTILRS